MAPGQQENQAQNPEAKAGEYLEQWSASKALSPLRFSGAVTGDGGSHQYAQESRG